MFHLLIRKVSVLFKERRLKKKCIVSFFFSFFRKDEFAELTNNSKNTDFCI